jgi:hypothetical protein
MGVTEKYQLLFTEKHIIKNKNLLQEKKKRPTFEVKEKILSIPLIIIIIHTASQTLVGNPLQPIKIQGTTSQGH